MALRLASNTTRLVPAPDGAPSRSVHDIGNELPTGARKDYDHCAEVASNANPLVSV
jgi:hypothetical protein